MYLAHSHEGREYKVYGDFHTHSIYSGHAMASPEEMALEARKMGLSYLAITDHVYEYTERQDIENQILRPSFMNMYLSYDGLTVVGGRECNLFTNNIAMYHRGLNLVAWHSWFGPENFDVDDVLKDHTRLAPFTHIMAHPERTAVLFNTKISRRFLRGICNIMKTTAESHNHRGYIEINTTSMTYCTDHEELVKLPRAQTYLCELLASDPYKDLYITLGSDAHCTNDICRDFGEYLQKLEGFGLLDCVVNIDPEKCAELAKLMTAPISLI